MQKIISCKVTDEYVQGTGAVVGAVGSHNDAALELSFSEIWDGTTKRIVWYDALGQNPTLTILTVDLLVPGEAEVYRVPIPAEAKAVAGNLMMTIRGVVIGSDGKEEKAVVSATATFVVLDSVWDDNASESKDITPSQAEQLQAEVDSIKMDISATIESVKKLDEYVEITGDNVDASNLAASNASKAQAAASASATAASNSASQASTNAANAAKSAAEAKQAAVDANGVLTFNGRSGAVKPQSGDYTADMVGARSNTWMPTIADVGGSNPNLLDNWYFVDPINQRGQSEYTGAGYTIDGWKITTDGKTLVIEDGCIAISGSTSTYADVHQPIEHFEQYFDKTVTLSVLLKNGTLLTKTGVFTKTESTSLETVLSHLSTNGGIWLRCSATSCIVQLRGNANSTERYVAVKLELGSVQTLAQQENGNWVLNDPPPDKGMELLKCIQSTADSADTYANKEVIHTGNISEYVNGGTTTELLWENASANGDFYGQTLNFDLSDCGVIFASFKRNYNEPDPEIVAMVSKGVRTIAKDVSNGRYRYISFDDTGIAITNVFNGTSDVGGGQITPLVIYGIKGVTV